MAMAILPIAALVGPADEAVQAASECPIGIGATNSSDRLLDLR
jgi:hypothetical protein